MNYDSYPAIKFEAKGFAGDGERNQCRSLRPHFLLGGFAKTRHPSGMVDRFPKGGGSFLAIRLPFSSCYED